MQTEDFTSLFEDVFFRGLRTTYTNRCYISCDKLLMSAIDTMAFIATGDNTGKDFKAWLDRFCDLKQFNITSEELWEHRNSMLHMTTLESRKVKDKKVKRLLPVVGPKGFKLPLMTDGEKYFILMDLISEFAQGVSRHVDAMNSDTALRDMFCETWPKIIDYDPMHAVTINQKK